MRFFIHPVTGLFVIAGCMVLAGMHRDFAVAAGLGAALVMILVGIKL